MPHSASSLRENSEEATTAEFHRATLTEATRSTARRLLHQAALASVPARRHVEGLELCRGLGRGNDANWILETGGGAYAPFLTAINAAIAALPAEPLTFMVRQPVGRSARGAAIHAASQPPTRGRPRARVQANFLKEGAGKPPSKAPPPEPDATLLPEVEARGESAALITLSCSTDNQGNSHLLDRLLTTKYPLGVVLMELAHQMRRRRVVLRANWVPRDQNQEADDLTNLEFRHFDRQRRIPVNLEDLDFGIMPELFEYGDAYIAEL